MVPLGSHSISRSNPLTCHSAATPPRQEGDDAGRRYGVVVESHCQQPEQSGSRLGLGWSSAVGEVCLEPRQAPYGHCSGLQPPYFGIARPSWIVPGFGAKGNGHPTSGNRLFHKNSEYIARYGALRRRHVRCCRCHRPAPLLCKARDIAVNETWQPTAARRPGAAAPAGPGCRWRSPRGRSTPRWHG